MTKFFTVNVKQIITLLGQHLYSTPDVVFRELIQNARDSIFDQHRDKLRELGRIHISVDGNAIEFTDNGTGMSQRELEEYLSKLGSTIKQVSVDLDQGRLERSEWDSDILNEYIGEYGIGFFSSFMIADYIIVKTRRHDSPTSCQWMSSGMEEYDIQKVPGQIKPGTSVKLILQRGSNRYANPVKIRKIVQKYCDYLDCPIFVADDPEPVNVGRFPWELEKTEDQRKWITRHLGEAPSYFKAGLAKGKNTPPIGYVFACRRTARPAHEIFCKRMFVSDIYTVFEDSIRFMDVLVNCDRLRLTLSRQEIVITDSTWFSVDALLDDLAREWLAELLRHRSADDQIRKIIKDNQGAFRRLALFNADTLKKTYRYLLFTLAASKDTVTIDEYLGRLPEGYKGAVLYVDFRRGDPSRQHSRAGLLLLICESKHIPVIRLDEDDDEILLLAACAQAGVKVYPVEDRDLLITKEEAHDRSPIGAAKKQFERLLTIPVMVTSLDPPELPLLQHGERLLLNRGNPLLDTLGRLNIGAERQRSLYMSLYKILRFLEQAEIHKSKLTDLLLQLADMLSEWGASVEKEEAMTRELAHLKEDWWTGNRSIMEIQGNAHRFVNEDKEYQLRCFIVISFDPSYVDAVNVITTTCESAGILAQTAQQIDSREILVKICLMIEKADFAIVDISESNPNVLLELGIVMARRKPAVIIRNMKVAGDKGVNVPVDIIGIERIEYQNTSEDLRQKLAIVCRRLTGRVDARSAAG